MMSLDYYFNKYLPAWYYLTLEQRLSALGHYIFEIFFVFLFMMMTLRLDIATVNMWYYYPNDLPSNMMLIKYGFPSAQNTEVYQLFIAYLLIWVVMMALFRVWSEPYKKMFEESIKKYEKDVL